jgi:uncharacterized protein (DUF2062 family)
MSIATVSENRISGRGLFYKLKSQLGFLLSQGMMPRQLALAIAMGIAIGLLPTAWGTSLVCILFAAIFRLNQMLVQLANYLVYPLQILLFIPYFRLGEFLFSSHNLPPAFDCFIEDLQSEPLTVLHQYGQANLQAVFAWLLTAPFLMVGCFFIAQALMARLHLEKHPLERDYS